MRVNALMGHMLETLALALLPIALGFVMYMYFTL